MIFSSPTFHPPALGPHLARLRLTPAEADALHRQGFVSREQRGCHQVYKLRFRLEGRQRVRYLTTDPQVAEQIREELATLQRSHRRQRELEKLTRAGARLVRETKRRLTPLIEERGLRFHGLQIRRPRR